MTTPTPTPTVTVRLTIDHELPVTQFDQLHLLFDHLFKMGATIAVDLKDDTAAAPLASNGGGGPRRPRGRPAGNAGTTTQTPPAGAGAGADDLAGGLDDPGTAGAEDDDPLGLAPAGHTPAEAKESAMTTLRNLFNAGHRDLVKAIQSEFGVAKFNDIDPKDGYRLLQMVEKAANKAGMRI